MSAIAGIVHFDGAPIEPGLIEKLTEAMKGRGPDGQNHWAQGSVALGHGMLRTTPESIEESAPLESQDRNLVLVWDGRLDNRAEIHSGLKSRGAQLRDESDAELVLQAYVAWGEETPRHLLGDFAFAVWDRRTRTLFCARDHMGARPFYYTKNDRFFAFASEEEVLTLLPGVSGSPNEERIAYFLVPSFLDFDTAHSWLEDVWSLAPAHTLTLPAGREAKLKQYWQLEPGEQTRYASDEECQQAFLEVFGESVRCRLRSNGHVAAMMSGGLDSASIAVMAKRLLPDMPGKEFHTYSAISDQPESCIESQCILSLTRDLGDYAHHVSVPSFTGMLDANDLVAAGWSKPHPVDNSILLPAMMCLAASRDGHRVMLDGVSGDLTTYVPIRYISHLLHARQWRLAWRECNAAGHNNNFLLGSSPYGLLLQNFWTAAMPRPVRLLGRLWQETMAGTPVKASLINPAFAEKMQLVPRMRKSYRAGLEKWDVQHNHLRAMFGANGIASGYSGFDRVAGRYGIELRDPWGDRRVVEFWLRLPLMQKIRDGWTKYLVRTTFASALEPKVAWRLGKEHLGEVFISRLMDMTGSEVCRALARDLHEISGYQNRDATRSGMAGCCQSNSADSCYRVYETFTLMSWLKRIAG